MSSAQYCPRCGAETTTRIMNEGACGDPECCGSEWEELWCDDCHDTPDLCIDEIAKYDTKTGELLPVSGRPTERG